MLQCNLHCSGIIRDPERGIIPRCLMLEVESRSKSGGCAIVGMNPGRSNPEERERYLQETVTYSKLQPYWKRGIEEVRYYKSLRRLANALGITGPILWTELAKCENAEGVTALPLQTFRTCTHHYLNQELSVIPADWPIIAVGRETYTAVAYRYLERMVVGVPHVTGSHGLFGELFEKNAQLKPVFQAIGNEIAGGMTNKAIWFDAKNVKCV